MGKRAIGELPVFDVLTVITLGSVVGADIADPNVEHLHTVYAIILIGVFTRLVAKVKLNNRNIGKWITFDPTVVIQDGRIIYKNVKQIHFTIDNILSMLREKDIFDISDVQTAVIEGNGTLSVLKKPQKSTVTLEDLNIHQSVAAISFPVIVEGHVYQSVLHELGTDGAWLHEELKKQGVSSVDEVFLGTLDIQKNLQVSLKEDSSIQIPPLYN